MQLTGVVSSFQSRASKPLVNRRDGYLSFAKSSYNDPATIHSY